MRSVIITLFLCLAISQTQAFHMPDKVCKKVEAGGIKMVSALLKCVEKKAMDKIVALEKKAHAVGELKAKGDALKAQASALSKKTNATAHAKKTLSIEKVNDKGNALAQKAQASALNKKGDLVERFKAKQAALTKKIIHALLSKVGCSKRRRLFHNRSLRGRHHHHTSHHHINFNRIRQQLARAKANLARKAVERLREAKKNAAKKLKKVACGIINKACDPACISVVNVASTVAKSYGIPIGCVKDALKKACMDLCHKICSKRRLAPRRLAKASLKSRKHVLRRA